MTGTPPADPATSPTGAPLSPLGHLVILYSSGLYTGYIPIASGTFGTALAILFYWPMARLNRLPSEGGTLWLYALIVIAATALAIWASNFASKAHGEKDPHRVVIDEIVGFFFAMFLVPFNIWWIAAAFFLFRLFDVWKPYPIFQLQSLPGGIGIVIDDVLAGIYTCVLLHAARFGLHWLGWSAV